MQIWKHLFCGIITIFCLTAFWFEGQAKAATCRKVEPIATVTINPTSLNKLGKIGIDRPFIFQALKDVSIPETSGCWADASGNFDGQLISVGVMQWNIGQNSLQPLLIKFKATNSSTFEPLIRKLMPNHGKLIFSEGCVRVPMKKEKAPGEKGIDEKGTAITTDCKNGILALQENNILKPTLKAELDALFESDEMIQVQVDQFVAFLESVKDDLVRMFGDQKHSVRRIKWAIDTKVQQGEFPGDADIARVRDTWANLSPDDRAKKLRRLIQWYEALSNSVDQGGIQKDWVWNVEKWRQALDGPLTDEQTDLLNLTFLRSRTAIGQSGRWQALTFQRRTKIILGVGSVGGNQHDIQTLTQSQNNAENQSDTPSQSDTQNQSITQSNIPSN